MAALNHTTQSAFGQGFSDGVSRTAYRIVTSIMDWNDNRKTRTSLHKLSDHVLEDIGLTRGDIPYFR